MVAFSIFKFFDVLIITGLDQVDTLAITIESIAMIIFSMLYFAQLIEKKRIKLIQFPMFWINAAILLYFSGSFFLFLFSTYIFSDAEQYYEYWSVHNAFVIIRDILFTVAMVMLGQSERSHTHRSTSSVIHQ